jgi:glutathione S-transferase
MAKLKLVIANKNYSSWSLRPWIAMKIAGIPFEEQMIRFGEPRFGREIRKVSKAGMVPVLIDGDTVIGESLAILEYLAERYPDKGLWPKQRKARAIARALASEMHAGLRAIRSAYPMNLRRSPKSIPMTDAVKADVARIETIWRECRKEFGKGGRFLFGKFCNADAMFAPVATRIDTYAIPVAKDTREYVDTIMSTTAFKSWKADGLKEPWIVPEDEVD